MVNARADVSAKYCNGDMSRDDYDTWRYSYPTHDETQTYVKVPSQALSNALVEALPKVAEGALKLILTLAKGLLDNLPMIISADLLWQPMGVVICFGTILSIFLIVLVMHIGYYLVFKGQDA